jgi:disulfide bond formation protein DsbB
MNTPAREARFSPWSAAAFLVAAAMIAGTLYMSLGLGLKACPLCIYERSFVMAVAGVLVLGALSPSGRPGSAALLALPAAAAGLGVAAFHVYLDRTGVLECPPGILGIGHGPDQSLAGFVLLTALLACGALAGPARRTAATTVSLVLGLALAFASVKSAPPLPPPNPTFGPDGQRILAGCEPAVR